MKKNHLLMAGILIMTITNCKNVTEPTEGWMNQALDVAAHQLKQTADELSGTNKIPRSIHASYDMNFLDKQLERKDKSYIDSLLPQPSAQLLHQRYLTNISDWTSGFFPGSLWYAYEMTNDEELKRQAIAYTNLLHPVRKMKNTHDVGFMVNCSYGNALRLAPNDSIKSVILETADNLIGRFDPVIGCIRSWDFGNWNFPVIIDNMMNLDLLFNATRISGDNKYKKVAVRHALTTLKNHFRPDYTCYHLVSYKADGSVEKKQTHQGKNDESAWARGQAWAVYGYTSCYRETLDTIFLNQARKVADMIMKRVKTSDLIPYWDFDAPARDETPRDASAAAIYASAMLELSTLAPNGEKYAAYAEAVIKSLSSNNYLAQKGSNQGFILQHSTGSLPHGSEIDVPLNYADYYYLEALHRYRSLYP